MGKRLLTKDYDKLIIEALSLSGDDSIKFYSNVVDDYNTNNSDLFEGLEAAINRKIAWFWSQLPQFPVPPIMTDKDGNKSIYDHSENSNVSLQPFGINNSVTKAYLEGHLLAISYVKRNIKIGD